MEDKNLQLERTVFFCDAVVAIAITLLAFNLKIDHTTNGHLSFADIGRQWKTSSAFFLSFINIASFWKTHHTFFSHIKKIDEKLLWYNIFWLLFIVILPFSTSLVSEYFFDTPAIFMYSLNTLMVALFQNYIWDYASSKLEFLKSTTINESTVFQMRLYCNLDMINALLAIVVSFISPVVAFILLFTKLPMVIIARLFYKRRR
ncbi:MAG: TMEM175 family protein [Ferruginibacter sp.]